MYFLKYFLPYSQANSRRRDRGERYLVAISQTKFYHIFVTYRSLITNFVLFDLQSKNYSSKYRAITNFSRAAECQIGLNIS